MKRVLCLLLCLALLCGLLPTAVLAENAAPLYFELCGINGNALSEPQEKRLDTTYGETCYFRVFTDEEKAAAVTGDRLGLWENNRNITEKALKWVESKGYYVWDTRTATQDMLVFTYEDDNGSYEGIAFPHTADVGWFSSMDAKSIQTALTYANEKNADVLYDGSERVSVYLTAEPSFFTEIGEIQKSDDEIEAAPTDRTYTFDGETIERGQGLTVTCPAGLSGEPSVTVTVRQWFAGAANDAYETVTYKLTFSADGVSVQNPSGGWSGEPVLLPGVTNASGEQVYFGIGLQTNAGEYAVASNSSFTGPSTEQTTEVFKPCFFIKTAEGYTETGLGEGQAVTEIKLLAPTCSPEKDLSDGAWVENKNGTYSFTLTHDMAGTWTITASCKVDETTYSVSRYSTRVNAEEVDIRGEDAASVDKINAKLNEVISGNEAAVKYCVVELNPGPYEGTIEIPKETNNTRVIVILQGSRDPEGGHTILIGGVKSDCDTVSVQNIDFRGANYQENKDAYTEAYMKVWPEGTACAGNDNYALYGSGMGNSVHCSFEGYKRAVVWTEGSRLPGQNNTYRYNDIGWYIDAKTQTGLNKDASNSRFEHNNYAVWAQSFAGFTHTNNFAIHVRANVFVDNDCDVYNLTDRWWYIPGNYFEHDGEAAADTRNRGASGGTSCYPTALYDEDTGKVLNFYSYEAVDAENGDRLSNALTSTYQTPETELDGKVFHVSGVNDECEDEVLATFSFPEAQISRRAPRRAIALFASPRSFDATVTVNRSNADSIVFTMYDPCKTVNVTLPCTFESGTVTRSGVEIENAKFDGATVSFDTALDGTYIITKTDAAPAGGGASGSLAAGIAAAGSGAGTTASISRFSDLAVGSWYYEAVRSALKNGLMNGTSAHTFSPDAPMTRAMLVTILWRLAGQPGAKTSPFTDVVSGSWYAPAVSWAYDRGIVTGIHETAFAPNEPVTREALVTILYRYAALKQNLPAAEDGAARFADGKQVSAFAREAVNWALQTGLLAGVSEAKLSPKGFATRAQIAVLLERFVKL